jgi:hypothetical protein
MLIRPKNHQIMLWQTALFLALGSFALVSKPNSFMVPFYFTLVALTAVFWSSTYTTLSNGELTKHVLWLRFRSMAVEDICRIAPHKRNGQRGYGTVAEVFSRDGQKLTLQPNLPEDFLAALRYEASGAEYLM